LQGSFLFAHHFHKSLRFSFGGRHWQSYATAENARRTTIKRQLHKNKSGCPVKGAAAAFF